MERQTHREEGDSCFVKSEKQRRPTLEKREEKTNSKLITEQADQRLWQQDCGASGKFPEEEKID